MNPRQHPLRHGLVGARRAFQLIDSVIGRSVQRTQGLAGSCRRVRAQEDEAADAYFISCTAVRSAEVIEPLERDLDRPVVTSNQAMVWHSLKTAGVRDSVSGYGRLMDTLGEA